MNSYNEDQQQFINLEKKQGILCCQVFMRKKLYSNSPCDQVV